MNIIYFHVHDQGRYVSPYGYPVNTPNLQRVAEEGVVFRNAFCAAPSCSPSRAALLTGQYPHQVGMYGLTNQGWMLENYDHHLQKTLQNAGYETVLCGTHHVTAKNKAGIAKLGYDRYLIGEEEDDAAEFRTQAAIDYLRRREADAGGKPFFLALGYDITHQSKWNRSYVHGVERFGELDSRYVRPTPLLADTPETRWEAALQYRASELQDHHLGLLLAELDRLDLRDNTLIIYTTDHGPGLPRTKVNLTEAGVGVSLVMSGPGGFSGGRVIDSLVSHVDLFPTICDLVGADKPDRLEGSSLMPLLRNEAESVRGYVYCEQSYHGKRLPLRSVRNLRFSYVRRIGDELAEGDYGTDNSTARGIYTSLGILDGPMPKEQLFDLYRDPHEVHNVASDARYKEVLDEMRRRLDGWMAKTGDPAVADTVPVPPPEPEWSSKNAQHTAEVRRVWEDARDRLGGKPPAAAHTPAAANTADPLRFSR